VRAVYGARAASSVLFDTATLTLKLERGQSVLFNILKMGVKSFPRSASKFFAKGKFFVLIISANSLDTTPAGFQDFVCEAKTRDMPRKFSAFSVQLDRGVMRSSC